MSYITVKTFNIDLKNLTIKGTVSPSNIRDHNDRAIVDPFTLSFNTLEELENTLIGVAQEYLDHSKRFAASSTFAKRVNWLVSNGYASTKGRVMLKDSPVVRDVLTGRQKIKTKYYIAFAPASKSKNGYNLVLKFTGTKVKLTSIGDYLENLTPEQVFERSKGTRRLTKLREDQVAFLKQHFGPYLEKDKVEFFEI